MHRTAREFATLEDATRREFSLAGSGSATVLTPAAFRAGRRYFVTLFGDQTPTETKTLIAGSDRRLRISVPLGPANPYQQDTAQAQASGTSVYTTTVTIDPLGR
jgi:hypothetical protein